MSTTLKISRAFSGYSVDDLEGGGGPRIAWVTDPAGNVLSVLEEQRAERP